MLTGTSHPNTGFGHGIGDGERVGMRIPPEGQPISVSRRTQARRDSGGEEVDGHVMEDRARIQIEGAAQVQVPEPLEKRNVIRGKENVYRPIPSFYMPMKPTTLSV